MTLRKLGAMPRYRPITPSSVTMVRNRVNMESWGAPFMEAAERERDRDRGIERKGRMEREREV